MTDMSIMHPRQILYVLWLCNCAVTGFKQDLVLKSVPDEESYNLTDLHIIGMHAFTGQIWPAGECTSTATRMALEDIGARTDILPGYRLILRIMDSACDPGRSINAALKELMEPPTKLMVVGVSCSVEAQPLNRVLNEWHLSCLSGSSTSVELSNRERYPRFFRTASPDTTTTASKFMVMQNFGWKKFATVHEPTELFSTVTDRMLAWASTDNFTVITSKILTSDVALQVASLKPYWGRQDGDRKGNSLPEGFMENDARIIFFGAYANSALLFLCELYQQGHYGPHIVLNTINWLENDFTTATEETTTCKEEQIVEVLQYALYYGPSLGNSDPDITTISGQSNNEFDERFLLEFNGTWPYGGAYRSPYYDLVWAAAMALNATMTQLEESGSEKQLEDFSYNDTEMANMMTDMLYNNVRFRGLTGLIDFDEYGDSLLDIRLEQQQGKDRKVVGYYVEETHSITWIDGGPIWFKNKIPVDSVTSVYIHKHVSPTLYTAMSVWAIIGVTQCCGFFAVNMIFRKKRLIKMSSPNINNLILLGCSLCYITTLFADLEDNVINLKAICTVRLCTFILGFTLSFGSLFAKTWRVHSILTTKTLKQVVISDGKLVVLVMVLMLINAVIICTWQIYDPFHLVQKDLEQLVTDLTDDQVIVPQISSCVSHDHVYFSGSLYAVQGITMIFGAFLAWETRQVKLQALNDSKLIGICIYNVAVLSILGGIILFVIEDDLDLSYGFSSGLIISGTMLTSNIIFVPKIVALKKGEEVVGTVLGPSESKPALTRVQPFKPDGVDRSTQTDTLSSHK